MKNLATALIALGAFLCTSCEKPEETYCFECHILSLTTYNGNIYSESRTKVEKCGLTVEEIRDVEKIGSNKTTTQVGSSTVTSRTVTTCIKK